jgi:hypothetical protein
MQTFVRRKIKTPTSLSIYCISKQSDYSITIKDFFSSTSSKMEKRVGDFSLAYVSSEYIKVTPEIE